MPVLVAGVVAENLLAQAGAVDVYINFGGGDVFMPEHLLYRTQVGAALEQVGGK